MSELLNKAINYACKMHEGQYRKMGHTPYIMHPLEVASIVATMSDDENLMMAALLHDTVEDCNADPYEIRELFGSRVYALVASETEDTTSPKSAELTWMDRKQESLIILANTKDIDVKKLWLSDKLSNMRSFYRTYKRIGDTMFTYLHQKDKKIQEWYYREILKSISELSNYEAYEEFSELVNKVFN